MGAGAKHSFVFAGYNFLCCRFNKLAAGPHAAQSVSRAWHALASARHDRHSLHWTIFIWRKVKRCKGGRLGVGIGFPRAFKYLNKNIYKNAIIKRMKNILFIIYETFSI